jgi:hypothetical protein
VKLDTSYNPPLKLLLSERIKMYKIELKENGNYYAFRKEKWLIFFSRWKMMMLGNHNYGYYKKDMAMDTILNDKNKIEYNLKLKQEAKEYKTEYIE